MDPNCANNMTGEPNQPNRASIFGFDPYPPPYVNWNQPDVFSNPVTQFQPGPSIQQPPICIQNPEISPFAAQPVSEQQINIPNTVHQFNMTALAQQQTNFSFGSSRPTQDVVQFPFQVTHHGFGPKTQQSFRCKRKTDSPPLQPVKQHITEEKMTEHMSKLHISSETASCSKESESDRTQRLYMCEEMRKLQTESLLPQSLLARIQRPCTALVLWKPPTRILPPVNNDFDENENNNEQQQPDNNVTVNESEMENDVNNMDMDNC